MRGFVQLPIIVIILLIAGGAITTYTLIHKGNFIPTKIINQSSEASDSAQEAASSTTPSTSYIKTASVLKTVKSTPVPSVIPSSTPASTPTPSNNSAVSQHPSFQTSIKLDSISPNSGTSGGITILTLKGSGFGTIELNKGHGFVDFYDQSGNFATGNSAQTWSDHEVTSVVPPLKGGQYMVEVTDKANNTKSNRLPFTVTAGVPVITSSPPSAVAGSQITLQGTEFGNSAGQIGIYTIISGSTKYMGSCNIASWTNTEIKCTLPATLTPSPDSYLFDLTTSDGRNAQWKGFYICSTTSCG